MQRRRTILGVGLVLGTALLGACPQPGTCPATPCPDDGVCVDGACERACNSRLDCPAAHDCLQGICRQPPLVSASSSGPPASTTQAYASSGAAATSSARPGSSSAGGAGSSSGAPARTGKDTVMLTAGGRLMTSPTWRLRGSLAAPPAPTALRSNSFRLVPIPPRGAP